MHIRNHSDPKEKLINRSWKVLASRSHIHGGYLDICNSRDDEYRQYIKCGDLLNVRRHHYARDYSLFTLFPASVQELVLFSGKEIQTVPSNVPTPLQGLNAVELMFYDDVNLFVDKRLTLVLIKCNELNIDYCNRLSEPSLEFSDQEIEKTEKYDTAIYWRVKEVNGIGSRGVPEDGQGTAGGLE